MMPAKRFSITALALTGIVLCIVIGYGATHFFNLAGALCDETLLGTYPSPDGTHEAQHVQLGCGATTRDYEIVTIDDTVVFRVETHYEPYRITWLSPEELAIAFSSTTDEIVACIMKEEYDGVTIRFENAITVAALKGGTSRCPKR